MRRRRLPRKGNALAGLAAAAVLFFGGARASAFCRTTTCDPNAGDTCRKNDTGCIRDGVILKWRTSPIVYRFHSAGSEKLDNEKAREAIRAAFDAWSNVKCSNGRRTSLRFQEGPDFDQDKPLRGDKQGPVNFGIYFRDTEWPHNDSDESLALTNQVYTKISGMIDYADIEINTAMETFSLGEAVGTDLQAVVTHEVGHYIGLAHSNDPESIMVARYCQSQDRCGQTLEQKRALSDDDINAVCAAYEPPKNTDSPQPTTCAQTPGPIDPSNVACAFGLGFAILAICRRKTRTRMHM